MSFPNVINNIAYPLVCLSARGGAIPRSAGFVLITPPHTTTCQLVSNAVKVMSFPNEINNIALSDSALVSKRRGDSPFSRFCFDCTAPHNHLTTRFQRSKN